MCQRGEARRREERSIPNAGGIPVATPSLFWVILVFSWIWGTRTGWEIVEASSERLVSVKTRHNRRYGSIGRRPHLSPGRLTILAVLYVVASSSAALGFTQNPESTAYDLPAQARSFCILDTPNDVTGPEAEARLLAAFDRWHGAAGETDNQALDLTFVDDDCASGDTDVELHVQPGSFWGTSAPIAAVLGLSGRDDLAIVFNDDEALRRLK